MYRALVYFTDLTDGNHRYDAGDIFPRAGLSVSEERIRELSTAANKRRMPLIERVEEPMEEEEPRRGRKRKNDG